MTDAELIAKYVEDMSWVRLKPTTISTRISYLNKLSRDLGPFATIKALELRSWLADPARDLKASTQAGYLVTYHGFFQFCIKAKLLKKDPTADIEKPNSDKGVPHPIPDVDLAHAFGNADRLMTCFLAFGAYAGCRCQEMALVSREDIHVETRQLFIAHGKGGKTRWVPLNPRLLKALNAWGMPAEGRLWDLTPQQMSRGINDYLHEIGISSTAHSLRHYFATKLYQKCKDLRLVQELLGHASVATTQIYAGADMSKAEGLVASLGDDDEVFEMVNAA